ncbi:hypothetical protein FQ187_12855 [Pseudomonas sp. ANT_J28]|nr:hypothetical protein FQ187_12855 [Pseudomonas sp. ANT_J28]
MSYVFLEGTNEVEWPSYQAQGYSWPGHILPCHFQSCPNYPTSASPDVQALVDAANKPAEVGKLNISRACGTCLLKSA